MVKSPHSGVDPLIQNVSGSDPVHLGVEQPVLGVGRGGDLHHGVLACPAGLTYDRPNTYLHQYKD